MKKESKNFLSYFFIKSNTMNDYVKLLKKYNDEIDNIELEILKKKLELTYQQKLLQKANIKKRRLLNDFNNHPR